jgi:large subunit ribosomal protein L10e
MRLAFGKAVGTAARVMKDQVVFTTYTTSQYLDKAKIAMKAGSHKLPSPAYFTVVDLSGSVPVEIPAPAVNESG